MRLIIYWLTLIVILPLGYLFWQKKSWRLILGIIILVVLIIGLVLPGKIAFSVLKRELKQVEKKTDDEGWAERGKDQERRSWQKLEKSLKNTLQQKMTPENQEKIAVEKEIIKWREEYQKAEEEEKGLGKINKESYEEESKKLRARMAVNIEKSREKEWEWARRWGRKEVPPIFLFCGEEFNFELTKERITFKGSWQIVGNRNYHSDVIDFGKFGNAKPDFVKKRIREIWDYWNSGISRYGYFTGDYPTILLKNIDKIANPELSNELSLILDPEKNATYGKYQIKGWDGNPTREKGNIDLSKFVLITTTSNINPELSKKLRRKLNHIKPFLDKHSWIIFFSSIGMEIIIFYLIKRSEKRTKTNR